MKIYNSLTRTKEDFKPIDPDHIKLYVCGPTVYSYAHIGNARAAVVFDALRCLLEHVFPRVTHVANITDIDDKIIDAANGAGVPISDITQKYAKIYNDDMASLGVSKPTHQPKATDHVDGMITMIQTLIKRGHAYENDGHVLFNVPSYDGYGRLSGCNRDEQVMGARVEVAPYKKDPADFVLWKPSNKNQPGWDSPWGKGRPGWHIECSVMAEHYLGKTFDIHGGGLDLTFPHHENEIAQSCCSSGEDEFANYWMHNGFVTVEGEKMSKSIGNVLLVHDMINDGMKGEAVRFALLSTHYRQPFDWTQEGVENATKTLNKWYGILADVEQDSEADDAVVAAMCDDMNTPKAIAELHRLAKGKSPQLKASANIVGLLTQDVNEWMQHDKATDVDADKVEQLIQERKNARANKDFTRSDEIRDELLSMGVEIKDGRNGTTWTLI